MASQKEKFEQDAQRMKTRNFGGYLADRALGRADFSKSKSALQAVAAPMGSQSVIDQRMKTAGEYKNGGLVRMSKSSTPYKVK